MLKLGKFGTGSFIFSPKGLPEFYISAYTIKETLRIRINLLLKEKINPTEVSKELLTLLAHYSKNENDKIPRSVIDKIDEEDLNIFAKQFIENNNHLLIDYSKTRFEENKDNSKSENSSTIILDNKELPKKEDETYCDYLVRFLSTNKELSDQNISSIMSQYKEQFENTYKNLYDKDYLKPFLDNQFMLKNELNSSFDLINNIPPPRNPTTELLSSLQKEMSALINVAKNSFQLVDGLNDIALTLLNESQKNNKKTTIINYVVITLAIISLATTMIFSILSYRSNESSSIIFKQQNHRVIELLEKQLQKQNVAVNKPATNMIMKK